MVVTVRGISMQPLFQPGDRVLVLRRGRRGVRRGQVVVVERPGPEGGWAGGAAAVDVAAAHWWIKRAVAVAGDPVPAGVDGRGAPRVPAGHLVVLGEGPGSGDSRRFGFVPLERVLGTVVLRLPRAD